MTHDTCVSFSALLLHSMAFLFSTAEPSHCFSAHAQLAPTTISALFAATARRALTSSTRGSPRAV
eukprot:m.191395 g.191395  ORF g.191395 m.191395 type:complete len:65 (+) comp32430_c0_seq2:265-459(+)